MSFDQELEYLSVVDKSENSWYNSRADFEDVGIGVGVEEYDNFTLYRWESDSDFGTVLEAVEQFFPLRRPALRLIEEDGRLRDVSKDQTAKRKVYEEPEDWNEGRWNDYSMIKITLSEASVIYDEKEGEPRVRIYEFEEGLDVFDKVFSQIEDADEILEDIRQFK